MNSPQESAGVQPLRERVGGPGAPGQNAQKHAMEKKFEPEAVPRGTNAPEVKQRKHKHVEDLAALLTLRPRVLVPPVAREGVGKWQE